MSTETDISLRLYEHRLRNLLPADLYAETWVDPSTTNLMRVFSHLRTLRHILVDYMPRHIVEEPPVPGSLKFSWKQGTLMFTDLAGFTPLMAAFASQGRSGAYGLATLLNSYFAEMLEIISKSGGNLLEFTGDALLVEFTSSRSNHNDTLQAIRAGLRMQRAMAHFQDIEVGDTTLSLGMRVGIHVGRFVSADIGTPRRMEHILLGHTVLATKLSEGAGVRGRVCLTEAARENVSGAFRCEPGKPGYNLIIDDLTEDQLGEYDIMPIHRRLPSILLTSRKEAGLLRAIDSALDLVEPLACFLPDPFLNLLVENASQRQIPPNFANLYTMFVNLIGIPESVDLTRTPEEEAALVSSFSRVFSLINAKVQSQGGVLKKVTYHLVGSDIVIYFGAPIAHTDDAGRAAKTALAIREIISSFEGPVIQGTTVAVSCKIGISYGPAFVGEVGESRGRRELNVQSDNVNIAARLMATGEPQQILMTEAAHAMIGPNFVCRALGPYDLKGKGIIDVYALEDQKGD